MSNDRMLTILGLLGIAGVLGLWTGAVFTVIHFAVKFW